MESDRSSSNTDDDVLPAHSGRMTRGGRVSGSGRSINGSRCTQSTVSMEQQIRTLELDAYMALLRAFGAQSESISWTRETLISNLRKELRIPDEQHRELLALISTDAILESIREWRQSAGRRVPPLSSCEPSPTPAITNVHPKKRKFGTHNSIPLPLPPPPALMLKAAPNPVLPGASRRKKTRSRGGIVTPMVMQRAAPSTGGASGRGHVGRGPAPHSKAGGPIEIDKHVGRQLRIRWPADGTFYDAVVTDYDHSKKLHVLVYDIDMPTETWEWVDLLGMDRKDLKWKDSTPTLLEGKAPPPTRMPVGRGAGRAGKRGGRWGMSGGVGRGKGGQRGRPAVSHQKIAPVTMVPHRPWKGSTREHLTNGTEKKAPRAKIQIPDMAAFMKDSDSLDQEEDLAKLEAVKHTAKEHEKMIQKALTEVGESSDDAGSDDGLQRWTGAHVLSTEGERSSRHEHSDDESDTNVEGRRDCSEGNPGVDEGGANISISEATNDAYEGDEHRLMPAS